MQLIVINKMFVCLTIIAVSIFFQALLDLHYHFYLRLFTLNYSSIYTTARVLVFHLCNVTEIKCYWSRAIFYFIMCLLLLVHVECLKKRFTFWEIWETRQIPYYRNRYNTCKYQSLICYELSYHKHNEKWL